MGKGKKHPKKSSATPAAQAQATITMSPDELKKIIAEAIVEAEKVKSVREEQDRLEKMELWRKSIHLKEFSNKKGFCNKIQQALNLCCVFLRVGFCKINVPSTQLFTGVFLTIPLAGFFYIIDWILKVLSLCFLIFPFIPSLHFSFVLIPYALCFFLLSIMFKVIGAEIENNTDSNYLFTVFNALIALITLILSIYTLWHGSI